MALILVADDDELVAEVVSQALSARGHVVGVVENGCDAVRVVELKRPAIVIMDCAMPDMTGMEALRRIRLSREAHRTPVLMLTGNRSVMDEEIALRAGANDYLKKPFDPDQVVAHVEALLAKASKTSAPTAEVAKRTV
jgi:DNA-binding response OmpR family regulator